MYMYIEWSTRVYLGGKGRVETEKKRAQAREIFLNFFYKKIFIINGHKIVWINIYIDRYIDI